MNSRHKTTLINRWLTKAEARLGVWFDQLDRIQDREQHIVITGLSRSGKSMLFTALIAQLGQRVSSAHDPLPLLNSIPRERIEKVDLRTEFSGVSTFPFAENLIKLQKREWPKATDQVSAFRLTLWIKQSNAIKQKLLGSKRLSLFFYDYPGEWLMDLPLQQLSYAQWSAQVFAQLASDPQSALSHDWLSELRSFDFDQTPNDAAFAKLVQAYQTYLTKAKAQGVSLLQPGALILPPPGLDWLNQTFCPLPNKILSDPSHPWTQKMTQNYAHFVEGWVKPFRQDFFNQADKQVVLVDVLEGLSFGRDYLEEMKEAMSHLSSSFVYGKRKWYQRLGRKNKITQVGFVATKSDLIPVQERANLLRLLQALTQGIRTRLSDIPEVSFEHFLIASLISTQPEDQTVIYKDAQGQTLRQRFEPIPTQLQDLPLGEFYPRIQALPPKLESVHDWQSMGLDQLMDYFLKGALT